MPGLSDLKDKSPRWVKDAANAATRGYAVSTAPWRPAPDFLIIGTKRGGTTSLFNYLLMHPGVLGLFPQSRGKKSTDYFFKETHRPVTWYRSHFHTSAYRDRLADRLGYAPVGGEASPYYMWDPRIAPRAYAVSPSIKAIALVRDPVERAWSHYVERRQMGVEPLTFRDALAQEEARTAGELAVMERDPGYYSEAHDWYTYRSRGVYLPQLDHWASVFGADRLLTVRSEDMYGDVQGVFDTVCDFLGLDRHELPTKKSFNASSGFTKAKEAKETMPDDVRAELTDYFRPHTAALEAHLGRSLGWSTS